LHHSSCVAIRAVDEWVTTGGGCDRGVEGFHGGRAGLEQLGGGELVHTHGNAGKRRKIAFGLLGLLCLALNT